MGRGVDGGGWSSSLRGSDGFDFEVLVMLGTQLFQSVIDDDAPSVAMNGSRWSLLKQRRGLEFWGGLSTLGKVGILVLLERIRDVNPNACSVPLRLQSLYLV